MSDAPQSVERPEEDATTGDRPRWRSILHHVNENAERYLLYTVYMYLIFIVVAETLRRFVLNLSSLWGTETARFAYIYLTYIGMSWGIYTRTHIRVDAVFDLVSERTEGYLYLFSDIVLLIIAFFAIRYSIPMLRTSLQFGAVTPALRVNRAFFQVAVPLGFTLFSVRVIQRMYNDIKDIRAGRPVYKGEDIFVDGEES